MWNNSLIDLDIILLFFYNIINQELSKLNQIINNVKDRDIQQINYLFWVDQENYLLENLLIFIMWNSLN